MPRSPRPPRRPPTPQRKSASFSASQRASRAAAMSRARLRMASARRKGSSTTGITRRGSPGTGGQGQRVGLQGRGTGGQGRGAGRPWWRGGRYGYGGYDSSLYDTDAGGPGTLTRHRRRSFVINWNDPMPLDQALNHPGSGVFIMEQAGAGAVPDAGAPVDTAAPVDAGAPADTGVPDAAMPTDPSAAADAGEPPPDGEPPQELETADGDWQPTNVGYAADGFGVRLGHLMEDIAGAQGSPDWTQYRVRLGVGRIRPNHPVDRALLRAVAHQIAARSGSGAGPTPQERRILSAMRIWHRGAAPDYLSDSDGSASWSGYHHVRRSRGGRRRRAQFQSRVAKRARF